MTQSLLLIYILIVIAFISVYTCKYSSTGGGFDRSMTDAYRGVAILMIIVQHCNGHFENTTNVFTPFGGIGVAIFLVLSGFGLGESFKKKGTEGFIKNKLYRVWLPFVIFTLAIYLLREDYDYKRFLFCIFSIKYTDYWFVHYLLRCYAVFWVAYRFAYKYRLYILAIFICYSFWGMQSLEAEQCLSFPLGVYLSENLKAMKNLSRKRTLMWACMASVVGVACLAVKQLAAVRAFIDTPIYYAVETGIKLPLALATICILWLLPTRWVANRFTVCCGTLSYELYLTHMQLLGYVHNAISASMVIVICMLLSYSMSKATKEIKQFTSDVLPNLKKLHACSPKKIR